MFGERLKNILQDMEISQLNLSKKLGYSQQAINRWCNNITEPDSQTIVKIANYLNVTTDYLLGNVKEVNNDTEKFQQIKEVFIKYGFLDKNEKLTETELRKIMNFLLINKKYIK